MSSFWVFLILAIITIVCGEIALAILNKLIKHRQKKADEKKAALMRESGIVPVEEIIEE